MSFDDIILMKAGNYDYQKNRANEYFKLLVAILICNPNLKVDIRTLKYIEMDFEGYRLISFEDYTNYQYILNTVRK